jgi:hypothetical protein
VIKPLKLIIRAQIANICGNGLDTNALANAIKLSEDIEMLDLQPDQGRKAKAEEL